PRGDASCASIMTRGPRRCRRGSFVPRKRASLVDEKEFWRLIDAARDRIGTADHAFDQPDLEGAEDPKAGFIRVGSQRCFTAQNRLYRRCQRLVPVREAETELLALQVWVEVLEGAPSFTRAEQSRLNGRLANRLPGLADIGEQVAIV